MPAVVTETFFALPVADMARATSFYVRAFGAAVLFRSPAWTSLKIAGVRIGLVRVPDHKGLRTGLHFAVDDLRLACTVAIESGGAHASGPTEVAPGVVLAEVVDSEGNPITLRAD